MDLELSNNYIAFFDKLEKSNNVYENILKIENNNYDYLHKEHFVEECVSEGGNWELFLAIINKYGIVPYSYMPNAIESENYDKISNIYHEKVKKDIVELIELKRKKTDIKSKQGINKSKRGIFGRSQ